MTTTANKKENSNFQLSEAAHFQNESLLMQFILLEFQKTAQIIWALEKDSSSNYFADLIEKKSVPLNGFCNKGTLCKFHDHLASFILHFPSKKEEGSQNIEQRLLAITKKILKIAIECQEVSAALSKNEKCPPFEKERKEIIGLGYRLQKLLVKKLSHYKEDERVLFFLLRQHLAIDSLFEKPVIAPLLKKMFRNGIEELKQFVAKRYIKRGFTHLLPMIHKSVVPLKDSQIN